MQVSDFYSEIGRLLNDPNNTRWTTDVLLKRMNLAATAVLAYTNSVKTKETLTPVVSTAEVQLDTDVMDVIRVDIMDNTNEWFPLTGIYRDQLDFTDPNWQQLNDGQPKRWTWDGTNQQLILVPKPSSDWANTNGLRVWEVQKPVDMALTTDVPFSSNAAMIPYHMAIAYWSAAQCWMDEGTPEGLGKSKFYRSDDYSRPGKFEMEIKRIKAKFDSPEGIPARLLWQPSGGRASQAGVRSKANPLNQ